MIGRAYEIEALREAAAADRSRFVVVYGRRRVGKTFLIREAFDYRFAFSHTGMETGSMADQLESFHESLIDQGMNPCEAPKNWIQAFGLLKRFLKSLSRGSFPSARSMPPNWRTSFRCLRKRRRRTSHCI